ncbi:MAG: DUF1269 domain-containing protein [Candidatus Obscuribacterales bacterium]|nr:DUF1269 domain-containing protein [Candidatus Obscuribacterales bacterium]
MSELIVIGYDDVHKAEEVRLTLLKMQKEYLIDLEDAVIAVKKEDGKIKLHQMWDPTSYGAVSGTFWGLLIGALFLSPFFGAAIGAASGAVSGALTDVGINDAFMKNLSETLKPGSSALFVLVRKVTTDKVLEELKGMGGTILKTSLTHENEKQLQDALDQAKSAAQPAAAKA